MEYCLLWFVVFKARGPQQREPPGDLSLTFFWDCRKLGKVTMLPGGICVFQSVRD